MKHPMLARPDLCPAIMARPDFSRRQWMARLLSAGAVGLVPALGCAADPAPGTIRQFRGVAYDAASGRHVYTETHRMVYEGERWVGGSIRYQAPDGRTLGEKTLSFRAHPHVPVYRLVMQEPRYEEAITGVSAEGVTMETVQDGERKSGRADAGPSMAADSGFHSFVQTHWDDLMAGKTVPLVFYVANARSSFRFRLRKTGELVSEGRKVARLLTEPDSLLRLLVDPLVLHYDLKTRELAEYIAVSNLIDPATRKNYNVRIVYTTLPAG